ncbi:TonB-dependent siderophore receptor [Methylomonas sp. TEB]|uniref:TonB-dependent siderophore receptor n=1 Tax=Methylomonas sp. TEB TaxID=3398229 RepID=UPI0039F449F1
MSSTFHISNHDLQPSRLHLAIQGILLASALTLSGPVHAESINDHASIKRSYHIGGGSLSQALRQFATSSGLLFSAEATLTDGKTTSGLDGEYTIEEGFRKLLAGSGLTYSFTGEDSVAIKVVDSGSNAASTLPAVKVVGKPEYYSTEEYSVPSVSSATKTDTPIIDTPVSIQTVSRAVMEDQQVIKLEDALKNVSGVQRSAAVGDEGSVYDNFVIRGFDSQFSIFRNGIRQPSFSFEPANIQQVEVLKGPAAILYGRIEPGGLINLVTRQPSTDAHYSLQQQFGSFDLYRTALGATGPINDDKSLLYRFDLAYLNKGSFRDFGDKERIFLAPSMTWQVSDATQINLNLEYQNDDQVDDPGIPALNGSNRPAPLPNSRFVGDPNFRNKQDRKLLELAWSHAFNKDWTVRQRFQTSLTDYDQNTLWSDSMNADNRTMNRGLWKMNQERDTYGTNLDVLGHFNTFGISHNILLGFDYYGVEQNAWGFADYSPLAPPIDIFNPRYVADSSSITPADYNFFYTNQQDWAGFYFQDQLNLFDKVHFLFGGRQDWATAGNGFSGTSLTEAESAYNNRQVDAKKFTPRLGLVYKPFNFLSLYANYVESFGLSNGISRVPLPPQTARQYEGGIKTEFWDGRFTSTLAFFQIYKDNIATADPADRNFQRAIGQARSSGIELDAAGRLTEDWSLTAAYALTDTDITKDNYGNQGHQLPNAAKHSANIWTKYLFHEGNLTGLSFGTGIYLVSERQGNTENDLQLPGYVRWDASVGYQIKLGDTKLTTQLNVNNPLDKQFYNSTNVLDGLPRMNIIPGEPRSFMGSIQLEY